MESIDKYYYFQDEKPDVDTMLKAAADAVIASTGDRYAEYFTDEGYDAYYDNLNGNYKGIGVLVTGDPEGRGLLVSRAYTGNPAYNAGVRDGDIITHVNGTSLAGVSLDDAADLLIGEDGSVASLTVLRGESSQTFDVVRGDVVVSRVFSERLDNGIGYICIEEFTGDAATAFNSQLQALLDDGITSLIIDIRNNPGGGLDTVIKIADRVLPDCLITTLEGQLVDPPEEYRSDDKQKLDQNDWVTDAQTGKVYKDLGRANSYIARTRWGVNAQPNYILLSPSGEQLVPVRGYDLSVDGFIAFLQSGLDAIK